MPRRPSQLDLALIHDSTLVVANRSLPVTADAQHAIASRDPTYLRVFIPPPPDLNCKYIPY